MPEGMFLPGILAVLGAVTALGFGVINAIDRQPWQVPVSACSQLAADGAVAIDAFARKNPTVGIALDTNGPSSSTVAATPAPTPSAAGGHGVQPTFAYSTTSTGHVYSITVSTAGTPTCTGTSSTLPLGEAPNTEVTPTP
jgi:hypothetical protein